MSGKIKLFFFLFLNTFCFSQSYCIKGKLSSANETLNEAIVLLKNKENIFNYFKVNDKGEFEFIVKNHGEYTLTVSLLGYKYFEQVITIKTDKNNYFIPIDLKKEDVEIKEILIKTTKPIIVKNDTIKIDAAAFLKGNESVVEDLLKNIPGIEVDKNGKIFSEGREIEKVMVDGDDFFEKGYQLLTKSMPVNTIEKVEILKKYSENKLAKKFTNSDKVALNLKVKSSKKNILFGVANLGYGFFSEDVHHINANLMFFKKKIKNYSLLSSNNIGLNISGNLENYNINSIEDFETEKSTSFENSKKTNLSEYINVIDENRNNLNNQKVFSTSSIFNISKKTKNSISLISILDKNWFSKIENQEYFFNNEDFINQINLSQKEKNFFSILKYKSETTFNKNSFFEINVTNSFLKNDIEKNTIFNQLNYEEIGQNKNHNFYTNLAFTTQKNNSYKNLKIEYFKSNYPQNVNFSNNPSNIIFAISGNQLIQNSVVNNEKIRLNFLNTINISEKKRIEFSIGSITDISVFKTTLKVSDQLLPSNFQNNLKSTIFNLYLNSNYIYKYKKLTTNFLNTIDYFNFKNNELNSTYKLSEILWGSKINMRIKINNKNELITGVKYQNSPIKSTDYSYFYYVSNSREFSKGFDTFEKTNNLSTLINYKIGNYSEHFFLTLGVKTGKDFNYITFNNLVTSNFVVSEKIILKNKTNVSFYSNINYYLNDLNTNLKLNYIFNTSNYNNLINQIEREVKMKNNSLEFESNSVISPFNFRLFGKVSINQFTSESKNTNKNLYYGTSVDFLKNKIVISSSIENYFFPEIENKKIYSFLDFYFKYELKPSLMSLTLTGKNMLNEKFYTNINLSDYYKYYMKIPLINRYVMLSLTYNF